MKKTLTLILLALFCICGYAQTIDPVLLEEMGQHRDNEKIRVFVIMRQQYDQQQLNSRAAYYTTRAERREFVVNELKQFAETSQYDLRHSLTEMQRGDLVSEPKVLWIANALFFEATRGAILSLADRSDIMVIGFDEERSWLPDGEESQPANSTRGITSNVTQVNANQVWNLGYTGQGVVVAVIDTGVNYNHLDLADHLWDGGTEFPYHGYDVYNNDNNPMDDHGHGTHCAGTICGDGTAGSQTGVAPDATLMCVKCLSSGGSCNDSHFISAMQWAVDHGCDVISMSLGGHGHSGAEKTIIRNACVNVLNAGVIASIAAGNEGNQLSSYPIPDNVGLPGGCPPPYLDPDQQQNPGGLSCSVCVGAVDSNDEAAYFTSHGPRDWSNSEYADYPYTVGSQTEFGLIRPDVCAPGVDVISANYSNVSGYTTMSGTSMATPCVAGCMALMLSKNINATPEDLCRILEETAVPLSAGKSNIYGYGRVDALAAIYALNLPALTLESFIINDGQGNNDGNLNPGEAVTLDLTVMNNSDAAFDGAIMVLSTESEYVTITNGTATLPHFDAGQTQTIEDIFAFTLSNDASGNRAILFTVETFVGEESFCVNRINVMVYGHVLRFDEVTVLNDGNSNGMLDAGETADLHVVISNNGNDLATSIVGTLSTSFPYLTINVATGIFGDIEIGGQAAANFNVTLDSSVPDNYTIDLSIDLVDDNGRHSNLNFEFGEGIIAFADANVKTICVSLWDTNGDGDLSYAEAAAVTNLGNAFRGNSSITSFNELQYFTGLTSIGAGTFIRCYSLTSIIIPNSVISIDGGALNGAFMYCSDLTSITLPNSVTSIGQSAFESTGLTSIELPNSLTSIDHQAFSGCPLTSIEIPNSVTYIGTNPILGCSGLAQIVVEMGNTAYDSRGNCNAIINSNTNELITGCKNTVIPNSVTSIGVWAFDKCYGLTSIVIPNSVTFIDDWAFSYCTSLTSIGIPGSVTNMGTNPFSGCSSVGQIVVDAGNMVYDSRGNCNAIINSSTNELIIGCKNTAIPNTVTSIGNSAFEWCTDLTSIVIPNSVTSIGSSAFSVCVGLTSIEIPNSVTSIGRSAFYGCNRLLSMAVFTDYPPVLGNGAFNNVNKYIPVHVLCDAVEAYQNADGWNEFTNIIGFWCSGEIAVTINPSEGGTVTGAGYYEGGDLCVLTATPNPGFSFSSWTENGAVVSTDTVYSFRAHPTTIFANFSTHSPNSPIVFADANVKALCVANWDTNGDGELSYAEAAAVTSLGQVFYNNSSITSFDELQYFIGLTSINNLAFDYCRNLTLIEIPNSVTSIGYYAFGYCSGLTSIEIPNSVVSIGYSAFQGCSGLASIEIPNSVTSMGTNPFSNCPSLGQIIVSSGNTVYDSRGNCNAIIKSSTNELVSGCKNTVIPNSVTSIGSSAFYWCTGLTSIVIPNSVTSIGSSAFYYCTGLTSMVVMADNPPTLEGSYVFYNVSKSISVYVPCSAVEAYQNASGWNEFTNMIGLCSGEVAVTVNPPEGGTVTGAGYYEGGATCTLTATPNEGYFFMNWMENGIVVSYNATYSFAVTSDRDLVANFAEEGSICYLVFDLYDSFGDGWSGNYLVIDYGNGISEQLTIDDWGWSASYSRMVTTGSHVTLTWITGDWPEDCSFSVHYEDGDLIYVGGNIGSNFEYSFDVDCSGGNDTQTIALSQGWNWFSTYLDITLDDLKNALVETLPSTSIKIKSQSNGSTSYNGSTWRGALNSLDVSQMYMISVSTDCEITLTGVPINPAEHPVTITNGVNWIAFPLSQSMTLSNAFAGFAVSGDKVKSQTTTGNYNGSLWRPSFSLEPGKGYMYISNMQGTRTFTFPASAK